jgi:hypothetical protein
MLADGTWDPNFMPPMDTTAIAGTDGSFTTGPAAGGSGGRGGSSTMPIVIPDPNAKAPTTTVTANPWDNDDAYTAYKALKKQFDEGLPAWTKK